jgi:uncharacterized protein YmfQ (DUF2313 family)
MGHTAQEYARAALGLLPPGAAYPRDLDSTRGRLFAALGEGLADIEAALEQLLLERSPRTAFLLLREWEISLGLPDECSASAETIAERRAAAHARWIATGGQSPAYFEMVAKALGYDVTITQHRARWFGRRRFGEFYGGEDMQFVMTVACTKGTIRPRTYGQAFHGEPFTRWGNEPLVCMMRRLAPAHMTVIFK